MVRLKLLVVVPHPDDETFGSGGTLLSFLARDEPCGVLTLTLGEAGKPLGLCESPQQLGELRRAELTECLKTLGLLQHPGSIHEQHAFPDGRVAEFQKEVTQVVRDAFARYQPEVVLTFPPDGLNGHRDHVATHQAVKSVWDELRPSQRPRLWYYALYTEWLQSLTADYLPPNKVNDVSAYFIQKLRAMGCHRSQGLTLANTLKRFPERVTHEPFHEVL